MGKPRPARRGGKAARHRIELSAVVIAKDEAPHIADLAASLADVVDELVLLDTGSTDETVELARAHGFRVFHRPWTNHFAEARNGALEHARGRWALVLDADERLVTDDKHALRRIVREAAQLPNLLRPHGFWLTLESFASDDLDPSSSETGQQVRMFDRARMRFEGRIHEWLTPVHGEKAVYVRVPETVRIQHLGYTPSIWNAKNKTARNRALVAAAESDGAVDAGRIKFEQARSALARSSAEGLERMLDALQSLDKATDGHRYATAIAARLLTDVGRDDEALRLLSDTMITEAFETELGVIEATALAHLGRDDEAIARIRHLETSTNFNSSNVDLRIRIPALKAETLEISGRPRESWLAFAELSRHAGARVNSTARGIARRAWHLAVEAGYPDDYLIDLAEATDDAEFDRVLSTLPEAHQLVALGARHRHLHGRMVEPDPRVDAFAPKLAEASVGAVLALAAHRLNTEPALALGIAETVEQRADTTRTERVAATVVRIRALLVLNHAAAAVKLAAELDANDAPPADDALVKELLVMAREFAFALSN